MSGGQEVFAASQLSDGIFLAVFVALLGAALAFAGWIAREMYRTSALLDRIDERTDDHARRLSALEGREQSREYR